MQTVNCTLHACTLCFALQVAAGGPGGAVVDCGGEGNRDGIDDVRNYLLQKASQRFRNWEQDPSRTTDMTPEERVAEVRYSDPKNIPKNFLAHTI
jgi:hypothetical protein